MMGAEESGGFGFGMHLPERDGIYADLLLLDLFLRERAAGRWPVSQRDRALPRARRAVVLPADRRPRRARRSTPRRSAACSSTCATQAPADLAGAAGRPDRAARHGRRLQVLPRRRLVAARPGVGHRAARPRLHGGDLGRAPRRAARRRRAAGARLMSDDARRRRAGASTSRGATSSSGRTPTATSARSWSSRPAQRLSLQRHEVKDESILVLSGRLRLYLEDDDGRGPRRGARAGRAPARRRPAGSIATRRSSAAS